MPKVTLRYNVSPGCCLRKLGIEPRRRKERIDLMLPYAEVFRSRMESLRPDWVLTLCRHEFEDDSVMFFPSQPCDEEATKEGVRWLLEWCKYASDDALHDEEGETVSLLTPEALDRFRHVCLLGVLVDHVTMMVVLDEALLVIDDAATIAPAEVLLVIGCDPFVDVDNETASGSATLMKCGPHYVLGVSLISPAIRTLVHEMTHVSSQVRRIDDSAHGQVYADALAELLAGMEQVQWVERISRLLDMGVSPPPAMADHPDIVDGGRWRMKVGREVSYATWSRDGAANWGHGNEDFASLVSRLPDEGRDFVRRSVGHAEGGE